MQPLHPGQETISHLFILGVQKFGGLPLAPFVALSAIGDLIYQQALTSNMKSYKKLKKLEGFFSITRSLSLTWTIGRLFQEFSKKTTFFPTSVGEIVELSYARRVLHLPLSLAGFLFTGFVTTVAIKKIDELVGFFHERRDAKELIGEETVQSKGITVSWERPGFIEFNRGLLFLQTVTSVTLAFISKVNFSVLTAINGYCLYKMTSQQFFSMVKKTWDIYKQMNVTFTYRSILLSKENTEKESCICTNIEKKIYSMCENHAYCGACLTTIFADKLKDLKLINAGKKYVIVNDKKKVEKVIYECYVDVKNLPSCPECRGSTVDQNELEIEIKEPDFLSGPAKIHYLNYEIGKTISVKIGVIGENERGKYYAMGTLEDGTRVIFPNIDKRKAPPLIQGNTTISATIIKKTTESGLLYLICESETLPSLREYQVGEEVLVQNMSSKKNMGCFSFYGEIADGREVCFLNLSEFIDLSKVPEQLKGTITNFDDDFIYCTSDLLPQKESYLKKSISFSISGVNEVNLYYGEMYSGERIYYYPLQDENIGIGSFVNGTVFDEIVKPEGYLIDCSKYHLGYTFTMNKPIRNQDEKFLEFSVLEILHCVEIKGVSHTLQCFFSKNDYKKFCEAQQIKFVLKIITSDEQGRTVLKACLEDSDLLNEDSEDSSEFYIY